MKQSRRFLKCIGDMGNQYGYMVYHTSNKDLLGNVETGGSFCCSKHETSEFRILRGGSKTKSRVTVLNFKRKILTCSDTTGKNPLRKKEGSWWAGSYSRIFQAQETSISMYWNLGKDSSWPVRLRKMTFIKLKHRKGDVEARAGTNKETLQVCKERARPTKIHLKMQI